MNKTKLQNWWDNLSDEEKVSMMDNYYGRSDIENVSIWNITEMYDFIRSEQILDLVVEQIKDDVNFGDLSSLYELLSFIPNDNLIAYLPDNKQSQIMGLD